MLLAGCLPIPLNGPTATPSSGQTTIAQHRPTPTPAPTQQPTPSASFTPYTIPLAAELGYSKGPLPAGVITYIANRFKIVALDHFGAPGKPYACIEQGVYSQANAIRAAASPAPKILEYWGFALDGHQGYCALKDPGLQQSWFTTLPGAKQARLDIRIPAAQDWWASQVALMVSNGNLDGIYIDGLENTPRQNGTDWAKAKVQLFAKARTALTALGGQYRYIVANGDAANLVASGLNPYLDGIMTETYDLTTYGSDLKGPSKPKTAYDNLNYLRAGNALAQSGKMWWLKAWPRDNFLEYRFNQLPYAPTPTATGETQVGDLQSGSDWAVNSFLAVNVPGNVYLAYSFGYDAPAWFYVQPDGTVDASYMPALAWSSYTAPSGQVWPTACSTAAPGPAAPSCVISNAWATIDLGKHTSSRK